jgi:hypothetical protein
MSNFEAFATGFLGETAKNINVRKDRADDYFDKQMERARTTGANALAKRRENLRSLTGVANTLTVQGNMPDDVLRAVVNEGPETLASATKIYETAVANGTTLDEDFWRGVVDVSTEIKTSDESLGDFLGRTVGLFGGNLEASKTDGGGGDPFSAFVASGLGYNAMDKARGKLDSEEIAGGYSAGDLIAMESRPDFTNPLGDLGVTINGAEAVTKLDAQVADPLTTKQIGEINKEFKDEVATRISDYKLAPENKIDGPLDPEIEAQITAAVALEYQELYGAEVVGQVSTIAPYLPQEEAPAEEGPVVPHSYSEGVSYTFRDGTKGTYLRDDEQGRPVFLNEQQMEEVILDEGAVPDEPEATQEPSGEEEPDPQAAAIAAAIEPGGNVADFVIRDGVIPQTLKLGGVQYWFKSIQEDGDKSYAVFVNEKEDEQLIPVEN